MIHPTLFSRSVRRLALLALIGGGALSASAADRWTTNYTAAVARAKNEHKQILIFFTGSDWNQTCRKLVTSVFNTPEFAGYAADHLVLVAVDSPRQTTLTAVLQKQNEALKQKYHITELPANVLLDANETALTLMSGFVAGGPEGFIERLEGNNALGTADRGNLKFTAQDLTGAMSDYAHALELNAKFYPAYDLRAVIRQSQHDRAGAIADFNSALTIEPKDANACNGLAWIMATSPDAKLRDGPKAVILADRACGLTKGENPKMIDTLAAAEAETGNFTEAVKFEQLCLDRKPEPAEEAAARQRLALYQQKLPYHEKD